MFQMVSDAIVHIMSTQGYKIFAYIDGFIAILPSDVATEAFQALYELICELGLPINPDKVIPPSKALPCLGIHINLETRTLSIDPGKLRAIHDECYLTRHKKHLSRKAFQSLLGKLLYVHKCVRPAQIFVNRMLSLFRSCHDHKRIKLTTEFYQDLDWFLKFLPQFNGTVIFDKPHIDGDEVHIDASLTGLGGTWKNRVYATPIYPIHGFETSIVHWKMFNVVMALKMWGRQWAGSHILFFCDNAGVVQVVDTGKTRDPLLATCLRNIWMITAIHDIKVSIKHIAGCKNVTSDLLSRIYSDKRVNNTLLNQVQRNY